MNNPRISIYIPVYNAEKYLEQCLHSILNQSVIEIEVYIHDDNSSDNSYSICEKFANQDSRIYLEKGENGTYVEAQNTFIEKARGEYIAFVDNDDWIGNDFFEKMIYQLDIADADCAISSYSLVDEVGEVLPWYTPNLTNGEIICGKDICRRFLTSMDIEGFRWNKIYKRTFLKENSIKMINKFPADIPWEYELLSRTSKCVMVNTKEYYYRQRNNSEVSTINIMNMIGFMETFQKISQKAYKQGLEAEAEFYYLWRSINVLFSGWKKRKYYKEHEWKKFRETYLWKAYIKRSFADVGKLLMRYPNLREGHLKFLIKTMIVRLHYRKG